MYVYRGRGGVHIFDSPWNESETHNAARAWCRSEFGEGQDGPPNYQGGRLTSRGERWSWFDRGARIIIWGENDAFAFRMRWC